MLIDIFIKEISNFESGIYKGTDNAEIFKKTNFRFILTISEYSSKLKIILNSYQRNHQL